MDTELTEEQRERIFERLIGPNSLRGTSPNRGRPKAIIIAGTPGSGKGGLAALARKDLVGTRGGHVEIDVDELRWYHPNYRPLQKVDDRSAAHKTHQDVTQWGDALRRRCIAERRNMIIDGTLKDANKALTLAAELRGAGYETEVRVIGLPERLATQGVYARYERQKAKGGPGRWVPEQVVKAAHMGVPDSIMALHEAKAVDRITIYHREPTRTVGAKGRLAVHVASSTAYQPGEKPEPPAPHEMLHLARTRQLSTTEQVAYRLECIRICRAIAARDSALTEPENQRAFELARFHGAEVEGGRRTPAHAPKPDAKRDDIVRFTPPTQRKSDTPARSISSAREIA